VLVDVRSLAHLPPSASHFLQIAEISVNKQLENVQKITFDDMFSYDAAIKADAAAEGDGSGADAGVSSNMELSAALWK